MKAAEAGMRVVFLESATQVTLGVNVVRRVIYGIHNTGERRKSKLSNRG
jgi:hypothetical protein